MTLGAPEDIFKPPYGLTTIYNKKDDIAKGIVKAILNYNQAQ